MFFADLSVKPVSQRCIEYDLNKNWYCQKGNDQWLLQNGLTLKSEQEYQRKQQCGNRPGADARQGGVEGRLATLEQLLAPELSEDNGYDDVKPH